MQNLYVIINFLSKSIEYYSYWRSITNLYTLCLCY